MTEQGNVVEGRLDIHLTAKSPKVEIRSTRPVLASRIFEGKPEHEVLALVPLLFSVCGQAQAIAAVRAIESARGIRPPASVERDRDALKQLETLREHLWRVLLEWPEFYGEKPATALMSQLLRKIEALRRQIDPDRWLVLQTGASDRNGASTELEDSVNQLRDSIAQTVFQHDLSDWLDFDAEKLFHWVERKDNPATRMLRFVRARGWETLGPTTAPAMPDLTPGQLLIRLDADEDAGTFIAQPHWNGRPRETGPMARWQQLPVICELQREFGQSLLPRLISRLTEIAQIGLDPRGSSEDEHALSQAPGLTQLEAARGRLCHRVVLNGGFIERYRILAPTEWNFGPGGPAAEALAGVSIDDPELTRIQAKLLIHAIDPCVGYSLFLKPT